MPTLRSDHTTASVTGRPTAYAARFIRRLGAAMQSTRPQVPRQHEGRTSDDLTYTAVPTLYLQLIEGKLQKQRRGWLEPGYAQAERTLAVSKFSSNPICRDGKATTRNPFWTGDLRHVKTAAYDWIQVAPNDDAGEERFFNLFLRAWQKHVDRVRMDVLFLAFMQHGSMGELRDVISLVLPYVGEGASWRFIICSKGEAHGMYVLIDQI